MKIDRKSLFRDESGTLTVFAVISYTTMIMLAGFAIDVAKVELERTKIQLAVDNAVLAGATLNMTPKPDTEDQYFSAAEIVDLYLAKADVPTDFLANYVVSDTPPAGLMPVDTGRYVEVSGSTSVATSFMHMLGFDYLDAGVGSTAMEVGEIPIEISLVIDVSASMASDTKLAALVVAAKEFVSIVMDGNDGVNPNLVSLSLVSYGSYVNAGRDLAAVVQGEYLYPEANINPDLLDYIPIEGLCGVFNDAAFTQAGLWDKGDFWAALPNTNWETNNAKASHSGHALEDSVCGNTLTSEILAVSNDEAEILKRLTDAKLFWGTSIDDGARWGVALLDPSMQGAINDLIGDGFSFVPGFPEDRVSYVEKDVLND
ncbi:MAG: pilus assembly protein TadG-related protein, partial [Pseudomonadota bacterium]